MKKYLFLISLSIAAAFYFFDPIALAQSETNDIPQPSPNLVISQIYGSGGASGALFTHDFVEIFNRGTSPVNVSNWSIQYASSGGSNWLPAFPLPNFTVQPGQYFLVQFASNGAVGSALPTPDFIAPVLQPEGFIPNLSGSTGKLALVNNSTRLPASTCPVDPAIMDFLGYGSGASCFEGSGSAPTLTPTTGMKRNLNGCADTDNNNQDFTVGVPAPRNSAVATSSCDLGANLQAGMLANPATVSLPGNTLLTVGVVPATTPPSTGITVVGNLVNIGGSANQIFFDNGTNGDVTAGDNVFSFFATIPVGTSGGVKNVTAVAQDTQGRSVNVTTNITVDAPLPNEDPLIFGNPSNAVNSIVFENNYLMTKPQFSLSYNRIKNIPNWTAWRLDRFWIGTFNNGSFTVDPTLPAGWYRVDPDTDYDEPIYDRGHMCPSGDRTNTQANNSATYVTTNIIPQHPDNNQGPWNDFENYCRTLAQQDSEIYIISGGFGNIGTIGATQQNRIVIPESTWKVVLVLPLGDNDLQRVSRTTRAFGIIMQNTPQTRSTPWRNFRVTVDAVEALSGYNFLSQIPKNTQELIERKRDTL